eukprot:scaffold107444_cov28-Tisochrysis_lutea.AAC.1
MQGKLIEHVSAVAKATIGEEEIGRKAKTVTGGTRQHHSTSIKTTTMLVTLGAQKPHEPLTVAIRA